MVPSSKVTTKKYLLCIVLTSHPTDGGKFQYSIAILQALLSFDPSQYNLTVVYSDDVWLSYLPEGITKIKLKKILISRVIRKLLMELSGDVKLVRLLGKCYDTIHKTIHQLNPDLVFFPANDSLSYEIVCRAIVPIHDLMHRYTTEFPEVQEKGVYEWRERHYTRICDYSVGILADSELGRTHLMESYRVSHSKISVLPYVRPSYLTEMNVSSASNLFEAIPDKYLLYPAQFWSHKNHKAIIEAIDLLRTRGLVVNAVFVGSDHGNKTEIISLIRKKKLVENIRILGYASNEELIYLYRNAVALVMPTFFGPTSIPPLEAMALGCPVITSRIFSIPDQLGDAALYVDPRNHKELAQKIEQIWTDESLRKTLIARGLKKDQLWDQDAFKNRLQEIVETLCEP